MRISRTQESNSTRHSMNWRNKVSSSLLASCRKSITIVRDVFIFAAFTGLAFIDVQQLAPEHIVEDSNGNLWIRKPRQKTKNMCNIPLLDIPLEILRKYAKHPACQKKNCLLPVPCNQKMNSYLKEIADLCLINRPPTLHVTRMRHLSALPMV